jgi:uncharacterized protein (TIGR02246 family)
MAMKSVLFAVLLPLALTASPSIAQTAAAEIDKANQRFEQAFNKGDAAALAKMYTEQATVLPPDADMVEGREAIQKFWHGAVGAGFQNLTLKSVRIDEYGGDAAREIGRFSLETPGPHGQTKVEGKYVVVWRKSASEWQLDSDIWNTNKPPEPAVATGSSRAPAAVGSGASSPRGDGL